jgi:hypothetical protein
MNYNSTIRCISLIIMALIFIACNNTETGKKSDLLNAKLDPKNVKDIIGKMKSDSLISIDDINNFHYGILNYGDTSIGKSVSEIMAKGELLLRNERLAELENVGNALLMKTAIDIRITNFEEIKDSNFYRIYVEFLNKSADLIRTNSGKLRFINSTGNYLLIPVEKLPLNLQPNQKTANYFDMKDTLKLRLDKLSNGDYKNLKSIDWLNTEIEFVDGRKITVLQRINNP